MTLWRRWRGQRSGVARPGHGGRRYEGQEWAARDVRWVVVFVSLVAATAYVPAFGIPLVLYVAFWAVRLVVLTVRRRRREREGDATNEFWADRLKP